MAHSRQYEQKLLDDAQVEVQIQRSTNKKIWTLKLTSKSSLTMDEAIEGLIDACLQLQGENKLSREEQN